MGKSRFEALFGTVDEKSAEASRVQQARPIHEAAACEEEMDRVDKKLTVLAKKDELQEQVTASCQIVVSHIPAAMLAASPVCALACS